MFRQTDITAQAIPLFPFFKPDRPSLPDLDTYTAVLEKTIPVFPQGVLAASVFSSVVSRLDQDWTVISRVGDPAPLDVAICLASGVF